MLPLCMSSTIFGQPPGTALFRHVRPWLPTSTEVAYVSNLPLPSLSFYNARSPRDDYSALAALAVAELDSPGVTPDPAVALSAEAAVYVGAGYRLLKPPGGLGVQGRFEGCSFLLSTDGAVAAYLHSAQVPGSGLEPPGLYRLRSSGEPGKEAFASAIEPNLVMICSTRLLAEGVLARRRHGRQGTVLGPEDAEWKLVDSSAPVWGLRRFLRGRPDPTSPLGSGRGLLPDYSDPRAVAMGFTLESPSRARIAYMTRELSRNPGYERTWGLSGASSVADGYRVVTMRFNPSDDSTGEYRARVMLMLLGVILAV